jgi:hypothetical protein
LLLEQMRFYVHGDNNNIRFQDLVTDSVVELGSESLPLGPKDAFKLRGHFNQPTYWYLVLIDTKGMVEVPLSPEVQQADVEFPVRKDKFATFDPNDPAGNNLLLLLAGQLPPGEGKPLLMEKLHGVDKPPTINRGLIEKDLLPSDYLRTIRQRLPEGVEMVHAVFVLTRR